MPRHYIQANTNGRLHSADEPSIAPLNRGFLYGDAIYEVWRTYGGVLFAWDEHFERLRTSARALHMDMPFRPEQVFSEIRRTAHEYRGRSGNKGDLYVRLQITRGCGAIGLDVALAEGPDFVILVQPCPELTPAKAETGLRLAIATSLRRNPAQALDPAWKTGNYLNNLLGLREARAAGADEVVMLNLSGELTEAAVSNIAFVRAGRMITPPLSAGILSGITRRLLLGGVAASAGIDVLEQTVRPEDLGHMDECFLISTTRDIVPVGSVGDIRFPVGPLTLTAKLKSAFASVAQRYSAEHPELAI